VHRGVVESLIKREAKPSAIFASRPRPRAIFPVVHGRKRYFNWFIATYIRSSIPALYFPGENIACCVRYGKKAHFGAFILYGFIQ